MTFRLWPVSTLKGGSAKTTSVIFIATELASRGHNVLVVDADIATQGVRDWGTLVYAKDGELPFDVVQWPGNGALIAPWLKRQAAEYGADFVLTDIGGEDTDLLAELVMLAEQVLSPVGPDLAEMRRLAATRAIVEQGQVPMRVFLTRVPVPGKGAARDARDWILARGHVLLTTEIERNRPRYAEVWGTELDDTGTYKQLVDEILQLEGAR